MALVAMTANGNQGQTRSVIMRDTNGNACTDKIRPGRAVLLPMKPIWAHSIADGFKKLEFRRKWPKTAAPYLALIYASSPASELVGFARIKAVHVGSTERLLDEFHRLGGPETDEEIREYFQNIDRGAALEIDEYAPVPGGPVTLATLRELGVEPPQSYVYISSYPTLASWLNEQNATSTFPAFARALLP